MVGCSDLRAQAGSARPLGIIRGLGSFAIPTPFAISYSPAFVLAVIAFGLPLVHLVYILIVVYRLLLPYHTP